eukprot:10418834-Alexandrium_andersonii.AAC.1
MGEPKAPSCVSQLERGCRWRSLGDAEGGLPQSAVPPGRDAGDEARAAAAFLALSLIHISEPTRLALI